MVDTLKVSAQVTAVDQKARVMTLKGPEGNEFDVKVGPAAINFDQVKVGDMVNATVTREVVIAMGDDKSEGKDGAAAVAIGAAKGDQPGGAIGGTVRVTATVVALDALNRMVALQFEDGTTSIFPVRPDIKMAGHKIGEKVVFQMTEMVAIDVTKP